MFLWLEPNNLILTILVSIPRAVQRCVQLLGRRLFLESCRELWSESEMSQLGLGDPGRTICH